MTRRAASTMCVLLLALTLAACGSSKKSSSSSGAANSAGDKVKAQAINLKEGDLPSGWTSAPSSNANSRQTDQELSSCAGVTPKTSTTADEKSPDFSKGEFTQVSSEVQFVKTTDQAKKDLEIVKSGKFTTCLKQAFDKEMQKQAGGAGGTVGESKIESQPAPSGVGGAAFRMTVPITAVGQTFTFYIDFVLMQKNRAEVTLAAFNGNEPFDSALKSELTAKLISRMASNA